MCTDELEMDRPILNQAKLDAFTLEYSLKEKDNLINKLKQNVIMSREYNIFRESKRESDLNIKQRNILFRKIADDLQLSLLLDAKKINNLKEKIKKKKQKIINLKIDIKKLNELINSVKQGSIIIKQNSLNSNSQNKTMDETPSTNIELYNKSQKIELKNKNNEKFILLENQKKFIEETINNDIQRKNSKITKAILSTRIPDSFRSIKTMSVNPAINDYNQNTEIIFENNNPDNNENINIYDIKNDNIN
jgi:hypothetical protein